MSLFIGVIIVGIFRNNNPTGSLFFELNKLLIFVLIVLTANQTIQVSARRGSMPNSDKLINLLFFPLLGLVGINLLGHVLGFQSASTEDLNLGEAVFLSRLGISLERVSFPFSTGFNTYSSIVGILLTMSLFGLSVLKKYRKWMILGVFMSVITLLLSDTRSALLYPFLLYFTYLLFFRDRQRPKVTWLVPFILIAGPLVMLSVLSIIATIPQLEFLARSNEDFATVNSRSIIWLFSSREFLNFKLIHIIGYGEYGHYASGASAFWNDIFGQWGKKSDLITPHSTFYSILFDYGYLGLAIIIFFETRLLRALRQDWDSQPEFSLLSLAILTYWNLVSITETCFGFYTPNILAILVILALLILPSGSTSKLKSEGM